MKHRPSPRRLRAGLSVAAALAASALVLAPPISAQFRASIDVVRVEALVLANGRPVPGLGAADFVVTDNGVRQPITVRSLAREPIDVAIALDVSSSVRGSRLEQLRAGVGALIGLLTPADRATLLSFDHALVLGPRDVAPAELDPRLRALTAQGRTSLVDAATSALVWSLGRQRPMLVLVFSDGLDTASWTRPDQALALARHSDAVVDAVVTGDLLPTSLTRMGADQMMKALTPDERFLSDLAKQTGGRVRNGGDGAGLARAFRDALEHFRARYEITYSAADQAPGWHDIDVQVTGRRGVTIHARRGYHR